MSAEQYPALYLALVQLSSVLMPSRVYILLRLHQFTIQARSNTDFFPAAVERAGIKPEQVEEVVFGNVLSAK